MSDKTEATETEEPSLEEQDVDAAVEAEDAAQDTTAEGAADEVADETAAAADASEDTGNDAADDPALSPEDKIAALEAEIESLNDRLLRAMAETENIRRRSQRDKQDTSRYAITNFARDMLSVADNLGRALGSVDEETRKDNAAIENLMIGVEMTERELMTAMGRVGVTRMEPIGNRFDPNFHEAMFEYDDADQPQGTVGQVIEPGYMIHERPLRPAKVGITKGGPKPEPAQNGGSGDDSSAETPADSSGAAAYEKGGDAPGAKIDEEL